MAAEFKKRLASGEINPEKLAKMSSKERREYFKSFLGEENARNVNTLFERKLLAARQWDAMIKWAKEVTGIKPPVRRDLIAKIEKMRKEKKGDLLRPSEEKAFLEDLAASKIGVDVSVDEAEKIADLSEAVERAREVAGDFTDETERIAYGEKVLDLYDYVASLKPGMKAIDQIANIANLPRALMATLDLSAPFRQGFGMVTRKEFWKNLKPMVEAAFSEKAYRKIQADIISRPSYQAMKKSGLRITGLGDKLSEREEAYMTNILEKLPGLRGSERAYVGFLTKLRADVFDSLIQKADISGEDVRPGSKASRDIASTVNNFTGAGKLINSAVDTATPIANAVFFSPRKIAASLQILNPLNYTDPRISKTARIEAIKRLIGMVGASMTLIYLGKLAGGEAEVDQRSSDFGKIKFGDTRFDVTGGNAGYVTLLARLITNETKSTTSDIVRTLGEDYGAPSRGDTVVKFFRNKLSPAASFVGDWLYGENAVGEPFSAKDATLDRLFPLIVKDTYDMYQDDPKMAIPLFIGSLFGFGATTYSNDVNWNDSPGKELQQFRDKKGEAKFQQANEDYNKVINEKLEKLIDDSRYQALSEEDKFKTITKLKKQEKEKIFREYDFNYKQEKAKKSDTKKIDELVKN